MSRKCLCDPKWKGGYLCSQHQDPVERALRQAVPSGMREGVELTIRMEIGFEDWGAYEDWGQGFVVEGKGIRAGHRHLSKAVEIWAARYAKAQAK